MINIDKIFPRLPVRAKLLTAFLGLAFLPTILVGGWAAWQVASALRERSLHALQSVARERAATLEDQLTSVEEDLRFLASQPAVVALAAPRPAPTALRTAEALFLTFSQGKRVYYQIRWIDQDGREQVRIDYRDGRADAVPVDRLQDKSDRYYVQEALSLPAGRLYISPMDLNVEHGQVEEPPRPVLRYALPLGTDDRARGILVINLFAEHLFSLLEPLRQDGRVTLMEAEGTYLASSDGAGSPFALATGRRLEDDEGPEVVAAVLGREGSLISTTGRAYGFAPFRLSQDAPGNSWVLVVSISAADSLGPARRAGWAIAVGAALAALLAAGLGFAAARRLSRPIEKLSAAATAVAAGDFSVRVECETNDEIEDLAKDFNRMAERLGAAHQALERWNATLRIAVEERTRELGREKEKLEGIVAGMEGDLCLIDRHRRIAWANRSLIARSASSPIGRSCAEVYGCGAPCRVCPGDEVFSRGGVTRRVTSRTDANGNTRFHQVVAAPVHDAAGVVTHVIELSLDVTDAIRREESAIQAERLAALGRLSAGVLHEIANPLAAIKTTLQVMGDGPLHEERVRRFVDRAVGEADRLTAFLRSFSTFARPQSPQRAAVDLAAVVRGALELLAGEVAKRSISVMTDLRPTPFIDADEAQAKQVALNLLLNALEASPPGSAVTVGVEQAGDGVVLEIADEGSGMDEDTKRRIFDPFFTTKASGSGLGLAVVHQIVSEHGGRIDVTSEPGSGARFRISWPCAAHDHGTTARAATASG